MEYHWKAEIMHNEPEILRRLKTWLMVVELGAPKPIVLMCCISMFYQINYLPIPHKNHTDIRFEPDFMMPKAYYFTF